MNTADPRQDAELPSSEDISALLPGYEILQFIAQGGMGAVYLARQISLDREVAIKILPREFSQDEEFRTSFETEAKCMARLNHPNLIGVYDFGETDGRLYIIMELARGQSLYHLIQQGGISPADALRLAAGVCHGLASAHAHGILHRDIKPANILLDDTGSPKIVDFGLARPVGAHEQDACFGTPGYTAPEVVRNPKGVSERTDIFSVGVMLYEMLTGALPAELYVPAARRVECHPGFDRVITRAIHQSPLLRYGSAKEMAEALAKLADEMAAPSVRLVTQPGIHRPGPLGQAPLTHVVGQHHDSAPAVVADSSHFARKLFIIAGLVVAIALTWQGLTRAKAQRTRDQAAIEARERAEVAQEEASKREALERQQQAAAEKAEQARREAEAQALAAKANAEPPMIALERLRPSLVGGKRDELPPGTVTAGDRARLLVPEPMTWHQARRFCEEHGGYLAVLPETEDLTRLGAALKSGEDAWVGGGTSGIGGWCWIDGTAWQHEFRKPVGPAHVALRDLGILKAAAAAEKRVFFIEWAMNGTNPGSLREEFQRCAPTQSTPTKRYPAGSTEYHGSRYLLLEADTTWEQAAKLAESAGGKLAVPSSREENSWLFQLHGSALGKEIPCWIGGLRGNAGAWHWVNAEPWAFATWIQGAPNEPNGKHCGCAIVSGAWDDFPVEATNPALIIEWSATTGGGTPVAETQQADEGLLKKRATCKDLVTAIQQRYDKAFATNASAYIQGIDVQLRKLPTRARELAAPTRLMMTSHLTGGRIPSNIPRDDLSPELTGVLETHLARQTQQDSAYQAELFSLAAKYRRSLQDEVARLKQQGQSTLQREVEAEIQATSGDAKEFFTYITGSPYPDGVSPGLETVADKPGGGKKWKVTCSGNQPGGEPEKAIDGDAETNWHTPWDTSTKANRHPHTLDIDFGKEISITGLKLTARRTGVNGRIKDFVIWTRAEGGDWKELKKGDLPDNAEPQTVRFPARVSTRHLRLESLNSHHGDCTSLAEVDVIY